MRLFVSVDVDELHEELAAIQDSFADAAGLRFTDPEQAHVTLKFLGETDERRLPELTDHIERAVADSGVRSFRARLGGLGVFPSMEFISVVWVGVEEGSRQFDRLHEAIEERTTAMGFDPEDQPFRPHVTLARMDHAESKDLVREVVSEADPTAGWVTVDSIRLTESTLTPEGPVYTTVKRFELPD